MRFSTVLLEESLTGRLFLCMVPYMATDMERTTVYLKRSMRKQLKSFAQIRQIPEAEIIREALQSYLTKSRLAIPRVVGTSRDGGVARNIDRALKESGFGQSSRC